MASALFMAASTGTGYEFLSTILIMSIIPVLVDLPSAGIRLTARKTIVIVLTFLSAFAVSVFIFEYAFIKTF